MSHVLGYQLSKVGGAWLSAARNWLQWNVKDGDRVTWGSGQVIQMTVAQFEKAAAEIAAAAINEQLVAKKEITT